MQLSTWHTASPAREKNYGMMGLKISAQRFFMHEQISFLTLSHLMYTSFIPSATGSRSLMPNFLSVTLTSGTTSQPEKEKTVIHFTTED